MKHNVGSTDKIIRIILGIVIAVLGYYYKSWWGLIALVPLLTAFISFCPLYPIFKLSTKNK
jgi:predicted RND superfamily exporter protein